MLWYHCTVANVCYHHVNLQTKSCTCYGYQRNDIPRTRDFALILRPNYPFPLVFLPQFCLVQTWRDTYSTNFHPIVFGPMYFPHSRALILNLIQTHKNFHAMPLVLVYLGEGLRRSDTGVVRHASMLQEYKIYMWPASLTCQTPHD